METKQGRGSPMRQLDPLIGTWDTRGEVVSEDGSRQTFTATDAYWWVADGKFLYHDIVADMPGQHVVGFEIAGYDDKNDRFWIRTYDNLGNMGEQTATMIGNRWSITGNAERFSGVFSPDNTIISGSWERPDGAKWLHWMDVTLTRRP